jgi:hypothetical protein
MAISALNRLAGYNAISDPTPFATPEERMGGIASPFHAHKGEIAVPYSYQSLAVPGARPGPHGLENQLFADPMWFLESAGSPEEDPYFDYNMPSLTRSHGSVKNVTLSGTLPSQADSVNLQTVQMNNKLSNLGTSRQLQNDRLGDVQQDNWQELWEINPGHDDIPDTTKQIAFQANGFGVNDAPSNAYHKTNYLGQWGEKHQHRRYASNSIPGNYMWLRPGGRPLFKSIAGTARPAIGEDSQFTGQDLGFAFSYDTGAILMDTPQEYVPPPSPNIVAITPVYSDAMGTDPIDLW